jgi:threonylcarbamoyladenosine tRNA methylthiotransferase MtaB
MRILRVAFKTLGCKLNQLETESVAEAFLQAGAVIVPAEEPADLYVVNTCTVTSKAEQKARRVMRQALAHDPAAVVLATGCYAQMDPQALAQVDSRVIVLPGEEKSSLLSLAAWLQDNWQGHGPLFDAVTEWRAGAAAGGPATPAGAAPDPHIAPAQAADPFAYHPSLFAFHSRPSLKIQDGCDNRCSYCRVCLARGPSRSLPSAQILDRVRKLEDSGVAEVVLTGVNLSQYKDGSTRFAGLLRLLADGTQSIRYRISSYEPDRVDQDFLEAFSLPRIQPHVHLALQSGSSAVLRRMARPYDAEKAARAVEALRKARTDPFIAADIILGFPGETDGEFEETLSFCRAADFAWIHAFPFSARPGTRAYDMRPKIPERVAGERVSLLSELASSGKSRYVRRWMGSEIDCVLERSQDDDGTGSLESTSSNYLKLLVRGLPPEARPGASVRARIASSSTLPGVDALAEYRFLFPAKRR